MEGIPEKDMDEKRKEKKTKKDGNQVHQQFIRSCIKRQRMLLTDFYIVADKNLYIFCNSSY